QRLYTGSTNDLQRRLAEHQRGKNRYTRYAGPFELVYSETHATVLRLGGGSGILKAARAVISFRNC
ncbi:MAG TPA: GIY-YIG nuclease family protein, partial [Dehalococcoidia bacterium]|nr:GIY-YIG nuclease family protein [Dehalococcoidia bacterium]